MSVPLFSRYSVVLLFVGLLSGCATSTSAPRASWAMPDALVRDGGCAHSRASCIYKGQYEVGEREYAVQAARRLNQASLERLRRSGGI